LAGSINIFNRLSSLCIRRGEAGLFRSAEQVIFLLVQIGVCMVVKD